MVHVQVCAGETFSKVLHSGCTNGMDTHARQFVLYAVRNRQPMQYFQEWLEVW